MSSRARIGRGKEGSLGGGSVSGETEGSSRGAPPSYRSRVGGGEEGEEGEEVRLLVRLRNGQDVNCFVSSRSTVGDLHAMAVGRSCGLGLKCTVADTVVATIGGYEEVFWDGDRIEQVKPYFYNEEVVLLKECCVEKA